MKLCSKLSQNATNAVTINSFRVMAIARYVVLNWAIWSVIIAYLWLDAIANTQSHISTFLTRWNWISWYWLTVWGHLIVDNIWSTSRNTISSIIVRASAKLSIGWWISWSIELGHSSIEVWGNVTSKHKLAWWTMNLECSFRSNYSN